MSGAPESSSVTLPLTARTVFARPIGSMTVTADGRYELRLRKEYDPGWFDRIELRYTKDGAVYRNRIDENNPLTLARLVQSPDIVLVNVAAD